MLSTLFRRSFNRQASLAQRTQFFTNQSSLFNFSSTVDTVEQQAESQEENEEERDSDHTVSGEKERPKRESSKKHFEKKKRDKFEKSEQPEPAMLFTPDEL